MIQEFVQMIEDTIRDITYEMHTAIPGVISSFDPNKGIATVKPSGTLFMKDGKKLKYPTISKVPVLFPQGYGQKATIAFPVKQGDGCLLIICENDLRSWVSSGKETDNFMKFDLTNAVCIPGMFSKSSEAIKKANRDNAIVIQNSDESEIVIKKKELSLSNKKSSIKMNDQKIEISCEKTSISVTNNGVEIEGNLTIHGSILEG